MTSNKTWWAPVWRGLVVDPEGKHCRRMKNAVWLYLYLLLHANRCTGTLTRKCQTIAQSISVNEKTIRKWLSTLRTHDYIETRSNGRATEIVIKKWKTIGGSSNKSRQIGTEKVVRLPWIEDSSVGRESINSLNLRHKTDDRSNPYDISIKQIKLDDIIDSEQLEDPNDLPRDKESFAVELSRALDDRDGYKFYLSYARKYPEDYLRGILDFVLRIPDDRIRRSRGAIFNCLVRRTLSTTFSQKSPESTHDLNSFG